MKCLTEAYRESTVATLDGKAGRRTIHYLDLIFLQPMDIHLLSGQDVSLAKL